jgi:hypothetical protein
MGPSRATRAAERLESIETCPLVSATEQSFAARSQHYGAITQIAARFGSACVATSMGT